MTQELIGRKTRGGGLAPPSLRCCADMPFASLPEPEPGGFTRRPLPTHVYLKFYFTLHRAACSESCRQTYTPPLRSQQA